MSLRIRQIVLAARDLDKIVEQLQAVLGVNICYHDPEVAKFGLKNALMTIGHSSRNDGYVQFLEVVSPIQPNTTAGRHLDRLGDSGYMLILQSDDLSRDRARLEALNVRIVWQATHADISAVHLHPKDIGAAIVSIDQPIPPKSWRWAGPNWTEHAIATGAQRVSGATIAARDPGAMMKRWSEVLAIESKVAKDTRQHLEILDGNLDFVAANADVISGFEIAVTNRDAALAEARRRDLQVVGDTLTICGTAFKLTSL